LQSFAAASASFSILSNSSPRLAPDLRKTPPPSVVLSVPSSFNQTFADNLARFENIVPAWTAGRSQRPLSAKSGSHRSPPSSPSRKPLTNMDTEFANMRSAAAGPLGIPMWKFEQQGVSALMDTSFRLNHGKVLRSPRSKHSEAGDVLEDSSFMPLPVQSSNTHGALTTAMFALPWRLHTLFCPFRRKFDWPGFSWHWH
jgi:hypothetical protein